LEAPKKLDREMEIWVFWACGSSGRVRKESKKIVAKKRKEYTGQKGRKADQGKEKAAVVKRGDDTSGKKEYGKDRRRK